MYLKKIEVQGFKSFAIKTVFDFNDGVTGIVGPNGSGKSNVSDAVRWVLGEQSAKQLRGGNMQDVIFAGTQTRKPQGFAYVALTLDNSDHAIPIDFNEVTVSRRLYRSGESEYMINGSQCRLKDVNEMFYDTGIGKDGYSIIGQGQIDKILSSKPEDRRELFDEAVGITKFKRRKMLTQKKLESEHQNLVRIADIITELESRIGPLEKQSRTAREFLRLRDELRRVDVNLFLHEYDALKNELAETEKNCGITSTDLEDARKEAENLRDQYEDLESEIADYDAVIAASREGIAGGNISIGDITGKINVLREQIINDRNNAEHISSRMAVIASELETREHAFNEYKAQEQEKTAAYGQASEAQKKAEKDLIETDERIMLLEKKIEDARAGIILAISERSEINANNEAMGATLEQLQIRRSELAQKILKVRGEAAFVKAQYDTETKKLEEINERAAGIDRKGRKLQEEYAASEADAERLTVNLREFSRRREQTEARLESLKNIAERYEGYGNAVKKVMEQGDRVGGVHGVVADLITAEREYETAIETALGGRIQNVVTEDESTAKKLIGFLKEQKLGRATFLPLTAMKERDWNPGSVLKEKGVIGTASSLVKYDSRYAGMVSQLLGRILVTDSIDNAIALQRRHGYEFNVVTKDGEHLAPGGAISGGAFKNNSNLLGRRREIEELTDALRKAEEALNNENEKLEACRSKLRDKAGEIDKLKEEKQAVLIEKNTIEINYAAINEKLGECNTSSDEAENDLENVEAQISEITAQRSKWQEDMAGLDTRHGELDSDAAQASAELESRRSSRDGLAADYAKTQVVTAGFEQQLSFIRENMKRVSDEIEGLITERESLNSGTLNTEESIRTKEQEISEHEAAIESERSKVAEHEKTLAAVLEKKEARSLEQKKYFEKRDAVSERINLLDKELFRLQSRKEKCSEKLDGQIEYMWNEYEVTLETADEYRSDDLGDAAELRRSVNAYKNDIRQLGPVNINAIDEYKDVSDRYQLMKTQHDDIVAAEEQLQKIITDLDTGMRAQFEENFAKIQVEFDKVFRELFGGGTGRLELEMDEETDLLDAGVRIIAQPPGKKLQNMMQLSGGEKALTAICLLFAIQNLKPSPFALLDEIEAALDDSNVDRFAHYLKKLSRNTQFIVITHRRGTMVCADRLYGITMQEKGVSTLVSVNLIEDKLDN